MDPFGYWLLGFVCIVAALFAFRIAILVIQPWVATAKGESFMEEAGQMIEQVISNVITLMIISVPVGAVYASYRLGADLAERWGW